MLEPNLDLQLLVHKNHDWPGAAEERDAEQLLHEQIALCYRLV
jgi:hypothetical protein